MQVTLGPEVWEPGRRVRHGPPAEPCAPWRASRSRAAPGGITVTVAPRPPALAIRPRALTTCSDLRTHSHKGWGGQELRSVAAETPCVNELLQVLWHHSPSENWEGASATAPVASEAALPIPRQAGLDPRTSCSAFLAESGLWGLLGSYPQGLACRPRWADLALWAKPPFPYPPPLMPS